MVVLNLKTLDSHPRSLPENREIRSRTIWVWASLILIVLGALGIGGEFLSYELRSYSLLAHFENPQASGPLLRWETRPVATEDISLPIAGRSVRARLYLPTGVEHPPGMVVLHGIHRLGIDEPRLVNFSRAAAGNGFAVLTPEIGAFADYRVDGSAMGVIGESPGWLRVTRFLATSQAELPDGRWIPYAAHPYGPPIFVYDHLAQFFSGADLAVAHDVLRLWLWEQPDNARALLPRLSAPARANMELLFADQIDGFRPRMLQAIEGETEQLAELSPHGRLSGLRVPVFILHGATDDIIPSTETVWLAREVPSRALRAALITPAFSHVDPEKHSPWYDEWKLVNFMAEVLRASG